MNRLHSIVPLNMIFDAFFFLFLPQITSYRYFKTKYLVMLIASIDPFMRTARLRRTFLDQSRLFPKKGT